MRRYWMERLAELDPRAPEFLMENFNNIDIRNRAHMRSNPSDIDGWFTWAATPQGQRYWSDLHEILMDEGAYRR